MDQPRPSSPTARSPLLALIRIEYSAQQRWLTGLEQPTLRALRAVSRAFRGLAEPHISSAHLRVQLQPHRVSHWLSAIDRFFATLFRRPRCGEVAMRLRVPADAASASSLALPFGCAAESGRFPQVTRLVMHISETETLHRLSRRDTDAYAMWNANRRAGLPTSAAERFTVALTVLFPCLTHIALEGDWVAERLDQEYSIYHAWGPATLPGLRSLRVESTFHAIQTAALPQLQHLTLVEREAGTSGIVDAERQIRTAARFPALESLEIVGDRGIRRVGVYMRGRPPRLPQLLAAVRRQAAPPVPQPVPPPASSLLRRVRVENIAAQEPHQGIVWRIDDEGSAARFMALRSAEAEVNPSDGSMDYRLAANTMRPGDLMRCQLHAAEHLQPALGVMAVPGVGAGAIPGQHLRCMTVQLDRLLPARGPLGADAERRFWRDVLNTPAGVRLCVEVTEGEVHVGLRAAAKAVAAVAAGTLMLGGGEGGAGVGGGGGGEGGGGKKGGGRGTLVVYWHGWEGATAADGAFAGLRAEVFGGGGAEAVEACAQELVGALVSLPEERRPRVLRLVVGGGDGGDGGGGGGGGGAGDIAGGGGGAGGRGAEMHVEGAGEEGEDAPVVVQVLREALAGVCEVQVA